MAWAGKRTSTGGEAGGNAPTSEPKSPEITGTTSDAGAASPADTQDMGASAKSGIKPEVAKPESSISTVAPKKRKSWRTLIVLLSLLLLGGVAGAYLWRSWDGSEAHPLARVTRWWRDRTQTSPDQDVEAASTEKSLWRRQVDKALKATSQWRDRQKESPPASATPTAPPSPEPEAPKPVSPAQDSTPAASRDLSPGGPSEVRADEEGTGTAESAPAWPPLRLNAVIGSGRNGVAQLNGKLLRVGETSEEGITLVSVEAQTAVFRWRDQTRRVTVGDEQGENF